MKPILFRIISVIISIDSDDSDDEVYDEKSECSTICWDEWNDVGWNGLRSLERGVLLDAMHHKIYFTSLYTKILITFLHFSERFDIKTVVLWTIMLTNDMLYPYHTYKSLLIFEDSTSVWKKMQRNSKKRRLLSPWFKLEPTDGYCSLRCVYPHCCS